MGCFQTKNEIKEEDKDGQNATQEGPKPMSIADKKKLKKEDFMFQNQEGKVLRKNPGEIGGQQFIIENCKDCSIFLLDYSAAVNIYYCENCEIFIGPCSSSVSIRETKRCKFIVATGQLRLFKCVESEYLIFSHSDPSIEDCSELQLGCFDFYYPELGKHFEQAKLDFWNNTWSEVHDFTPKKESYSFLPLEKKMPDVFSRKQFKTEAGWIVPTTTGKAKYNFPFLVFYLFFSPKKLEDCYTKLRQLLDPKGETSGLCFTRSVMPSDIQAKQIFALENKERATLIERIINKKIVFWIIGSNTSETQEKVQSEIQTHFNDPSNFYFCDNKKMIEHIIKLMVVEWKQKGNSFGT